ncbi:hypothetical protein SBA3_3810005 [Candidatus Sulfopaludibacter sp. SbA3]|nr:hypothetical protein SBA3_3810005 [Candidatus Sulfopaludibacter sp. SbA3]
MRLPGAGDSVRLAARGTIMTGIRVRNSQWIGLSVAGVMALGLAAQTRDLGDAKPETVGFSAQRLERLHAVLQKYVDTQQLPGMVTVLARHGKIVDFRTYGKRDLASGAPMEKDAIFRIYSMTKPITGVAMMILYEQGKWSPADPIAKYIPEFAHLKVYKGADDAGKPILVNPAHAPTMAEFLRHLRNNGGRQDVSRRAGAGIEESAADDRQVGRDSAALPAGHPVGLQRFRGHPGVPGGETVGPVAGGIHAPEHLAAAGNEGHGLPRGAG